LQPRVFRKHDEETISNGIKLKAEWSVDHMFSAFGWVPSARPVEWLHLSAPGGSTSAKEQCRASAHSERQIYSCCCRCAW